MDAALFLIGGFQMGRTSLAQRLEWLKNGHATDSEFCVRQVRNVLKLTMFQYFAGSLTPMQQMAERLGISVEQVRTMTYADVLKRIDAFRQSDQTKPLAADAVELLAVPYVREGRRRFRND